MNKFTVEETNLLSIYIGEDRQELTDNLTAALPYMDGDMKEIAKRALSKVAAMTEAEYGELALYAADEV